METKALEGCMESMKSYSTRVTQSTCSHTHSYLAISLLHVGLLHLECDLYSSEFGKRILCSMFKGCDLCSRATYTPANTVLVPRVLTI